MESPVLPEPMSRNVKFHFDNNFLEDSDCRSYGGIRLYQTGDLNCEYGYVCREHRQYCHEISYIVSGEGEFYQDGRSFHVTRGDIFINTQGRLHRWEAGRQDSFRFFYLGFTVEEAYRERYREILELFEGDTRLARDKYNLYNHFTGIFSELTEDKPYQDILIRDYVEQILVLTYRNFLSERRKSYSPKPVNKTGDEIVYDMVHYIDSNIFAIQTLESVGDAMGYSYSYLSRLFSQKMGRTLKEYFQERRFDRAVTLLKEGMSITDAAQMLGYDSIYSFSRAFKKQFGSSPTAMMRTEHPRPSGDTPGGV